MIDKKGNQLRYLKYCCMPSTNLRAARANRVFRTDEKRIRAENAVMNKSNKCPGLGFTQDRRLRADVLFIRAQSTIRADGFSSAQQRKPAITQGAIPVATRGWSHNPGRQ